MRDFFVLTVEAFVDVPVFVTPQYVYLQAGGNEQAAEDVEIASGLERPLTLEPEEFNLENQVAYTIHEIEEGKKFNVVFKTLPGAQTTPDGVLKIRTNYPEMPYLTIKIRVNRIPAAGGR